MCKINIKDKRIISLLDMDARMPSKEVAKKSRISREVADYRIKRLKKTGIISDSHTVFDLDIIDYKSFRLLLRLFNLDKADKAKLLNFLINHQNIWWVASIGGRWDIIINLVARDSAEFNGIFEEIIDKYGEYLQDYEVLIYIDIHDYPRNYLLNQKKDNFFYQAMRYKPDIVLDKTDYKIMQIISNNAELSYTEIGNRIKLSRNAVKKRIKELEKSGLILGYRLSLHPSKIGRSSYLLMLNINNLKKERERQLLTFAQLKQEIIFAVKHIGKYRITFECEVENEKKFHELLSEIRDNFNDIILDFDFFPIFYDHKINYFPLKIDN